MTTRRWQRRGCPKWCTASVVALPLDLLLLLAVVFASVASASTTAALDTWFEFPATNAVSGVHNASVRQFDNTADEGACRALATKHNATVYTWHDRQAAGGYALACVLRLDGVWAPVPQAHHFSAVWASARPPSPVPPVPNPKPPPCQLNGVLSASGTCTCDPGWVGPACGQLNLEPAPPLAEQVTAAAALSTDNAAANATWGISVVGPVGGIFHGYMTEIANQCLLGEYGIASQIIHMTSGSPLGPWIRRGVALKGFAHNPQALLAPNGSILLFHIGQEEAAGCLADCRGTPPDNRTHSPHPPKPRPSSCKRLSHGASVAIADQPEGPFTRFPYAFHTGTTNPTALLMANGTIIVALRRSTSAHQPLYRGHVDSPAGPWVALQATVVATSAGSPHMYEEDPFLFSTSRGFHMLTRRSVGRGLVLVDDDKRSCPPACELPGGYCFSPCPDASGGEGLCGGGHLFSTDLSTWFFGENVYDHSAEGAAQCDIHFAAAGGGRGAPVKARLTSRERPTMYTAPDGSRYLFTGAALNKTMYMHSFTLVQQVQMQKTDDDDHDDDHDGNDPNEFRPVGGILCPKALESFVFARAAQSATTLFVRAGTYKVPGPEQPGGYGACGAHVCLGHDTIGITGVSLDMSGVTFILGQRNRTAVVVQNAVNFTLTGLTTQFSDFPTNQAKLTIKSGAMTATIPAGYPLADWKAFAAGGTKNGKTTMSCNIFDSKTRNWKKGTAGLPITVHATSEPRLFAVDTPAFHQPRFANSNIADGDLLGCRPLEAAFTFHVQNCSGSTFRGITLAGGTSFGYFMGGSKGLQNLFDNVRIIRPPKPVGASEQPLLAMGADGFHNAANKIGPKIINSYFGQQCFSCVSLRLLSCA